MGAEMSAEPFAYMTPRPLPISKPFLVMGNALNGSPKMVVAILNEAEPLNPQLAVFAANNGFDPARGVVAILCAAAVGGPHGMGPTG